MTDPVTLTLVRYPPRDIGERRGKRRVRIPLRGIATASVCLLWLPAAFHVGVAAGGIGWTAEGGAWLQLAALAAGGVPLGLACRVLWRRAHTVACWTALGVLGPAAVAGTVAVEGFGPLALATVAAAASVPAWLACARRRRPGGLAD